MKNIFISYSQKNSAIAENLEHDLENQHSNCFIWRDKPSIKPGSIFQSSIDDALMRSDFVLGIITKDFIDSENAMDEAYYAKKHDKFIPLFFEPIETLQLPPTIENVQGIKFNEDYDNALNDLFDTVFPDEESSSDVLAKIEGKDSPNPFSRVRAEYFDHDYESLAKAFFEPEKEKYDMIKGRKPVIIFGGRGSGKTMILKSLAVDVAVQRSGAKSFKESKLDFFAIYFKLAPGVFAISDEKIVNVIGLERSKALFINHFNLTFLLQLVEVLNKYKKNPPLALSIDRESEAKISKKIYEVITPDASDVANTFLELIGHIDHERRKLDDYITRLIIGENTTFSGFYLNCEYFINTVCKIVVTEIADLSGCRIYYLLDEYENLLPFQQECINTLIKYDPQYVGFKIATKFEGLIEPPMTFFGQSLQSGHDYDCISLDYDLNNGFDEYKKLVLGITKKMLENEGYSSNDIENYLVKHSGIEISDEKFTEEFENFVISRGDKPKKLTKEEKDKLLKHYKTTIIFRGLNTKHGKYYTGVDTFLYLSSGIIRYFLNLCGMAFYRADALGIDTKKGVPIPPEHQTWAAYKISESYLERLYSNLENHGEIAQGFVMDIGDLFRERLLHHNSETETLALNVVDYEDLANHKELNIFLKALIRESILHKKPISKSYRPKSSERTRETVLRLNRIYAPALEISYRSRWERYTIRLSELKKLIDKKERKKAKSLLQKKQRKVRGRKGESLQPFLDYAGE